MSAANQLVVVCDTDSCPYDRKPRVVALPTVAAGLYMRAPVFCECGSESECRIVPETE